MSILSLPNVSIGGTKKPFGGYIYNLSFNVAAGLDGEDATTLTVDLASEDGTYFISDADLNTTRSYNVVIGSFKLPMYLKAFRKVVSPKGDLLQITLVDGAFMLDKFWVGLDKHVWDLEDKTAGNPPAWLIVVGKEIDPCDTNRDGTVDKSDLFDPCDPCIPDSLKSAIQDGQVSPPEVQNAIMDCNERRRLEIWDVQYGFDDLLAAVRQKTGIQFASANLNSISSPNPKYKQKYAGRLRDVLKQWCADFGWTFFYTDKTVVFVDASHPLRIIKGIQDFCPNVGEYVEEHSLEGTVQGNLITHFRRPGEFRSYECEEARFIAMAPYGPGSDYVVPNLAITDDIDQIAAGFSMYDVYLRDLYWWFIKHKMWKTDKLVPGAKFPELGLVALTKPLTLDLKGATPNNPAQQSTVDPGTMLTFANGYPLGQADIDKSFLAAVGLNQWLTTVQQAILADDTFQKLFNLLPPKEQWAFAANANQYYFFIGYYDEQLEFEQIQQEQEFASEFMGRYYIYQPNLNDIQEKAFFEDSRIISDITQCSRPELIEDGHLSWDIKPNGNEGSAEYWNAPATTAAGDTSIYSRLPYAKFLKIFRNTNGNPQTTPSYRRDNFKLLTVSINGDRFFPTPTSRGSESDNKSKFPIQDKDLIHQAHTYYLRKVPSKLDNTQEDVLSAIIVGNPQYLQNATDAVKDTTKIFLFWGRTAKEEDFRLTQAPLWYHEAQMPGYKFDGMPLNKRLDEITNINEIVYKYPQLRCKDIGRWNNRAPHYTLHTPVAEFGYTGPSNSTYGVIIEKHKTIKIRTERAQWFFVEGDNPGPQTLSLNVTQNDIGDDVINNRVMRDSSCKYDKNTIQRLHNERKNGLIYSNTQPAIRRSFTIAGALSSIPSITDGLMSLDMTIDKSEGLKTSVVIGTENMIVPNPDIMNGLEFYTTKQLQTRVPLETPYRNS